MTKVKGRDTGREPALVSGFTFNARVTQKAIRNINRQIRRQAGGLHTQFRVYTCTDLIVLACVASVIRELSKKATYTIRRGAMNAAIFVQLGRNSAYATMMIRAVPSAFRHLV